MKRATQHKLNSRACARYLVTFFQKRPDRTGIMLIATILLSIIFFSCTTKKDQEERAMFEAIDSKSTGISFTNKLTATPQFNMFKYMYF